MPTCVATQKLGDHTVLRLMHGDITTSRADAIVNAANAQLQHGGGVAGAIAQVGGRAIQTESRAWVQEHGPVRHERPAVTGAGNLQAKYVIHAVGPVWGEGDEDAKLVTAVQASLEAAEKRSLRSIALPAISTGIFGFPKTRGAVVILHAIVDYTEHHPGTSLHDIQLVLIDDSSVAIFRDRMAQCWPRSEGSS